MSHFTKVATKINHLPSLIAALDKLERQYAVGSAECPAAVRGYAGQGVAAEVAVNFGTYDLGLVRGSDGCYEVVADWWGIETTTGRTEAEVMNEINRTYAVERVYASCREAGYDFEGLPEVQEDGSVVLCASRWS